MTLLVLMKSNLVHIIFIINNRKLVSSCPTPDLSKINELFLSACTYIYVNIIHNDSRLSTIIFFKDAILSQPKV